MIMVKCEACGATEMKKVGNSYECLYCGTTYIADEEKEPFSTKPEVPSVFALVVEARRLHQNSKYSEELELLEKAASLDNTNPDVLVCLGRCYRCLGYVDKAIDCYYNTIKLAPSMGVAYTNLGGIYILRQDYKEAAKWYEKGLPLIDKAEFDYWQARAHYAIAVAKLYDSKKAEEMIAEAEAHGYKNGAAVRKLAGIKHKSFITKLTDLFRN